MIIEIKSGNPVRRWHSMELARRSLGESADVRDVADDSPEALALAAAEQAKRDAEAADQSDRNNLRQQLRDETEAQWLARTDTQRMKFILKVLKAIEKRI